MPGHASGFPIRSLELKAGAPSPTHPPPPPGGVLSLRSEEGLSNQTAVEANVPWRSPRWPRARTDPNTISFVACDGFRSLAHLGRRPQSLRAEGAHRKRRPRPAVWSTCPPGSTTSRFSTFSRVVP